MTRSWGKASLDLCCKHQADSPRDGLIVRVILSGFLYVISSQETERQISVYLARALSQ